MPPRAPDPRPQRTRRAILDAAAETVRGGDDDWTISQVAKQADVGVGSIYKHFETKEALLIAVIDDVATPVIEALDAARSDAAPDVRAEAIGRALLDFAVEHPVLYLSLLGSVSSPELDGTPSGRHLVENLHRLATELQADLTEAAGSESAAPEATAVLLSAWTGIAASCVRRDELAISRPLADQALQHALHAQLRTPA